MIMDNQHQTAKAGKARINVLEDNELRAWSDKLDVTKVKLKAAVNAVGPFVKDVEAYLRKK
jgi:hypothetical protein